MDKEKPKLILSLIFPTCLIVAIWIVKIIETSFGYNLYYLGIKPLEFNGLLGIVTSPFIHADYSHLIANTLPLFLLCWGLFYFYRKISFQVFFLIYFITGIWVWTFARDAYHIGASGIVYALASFLFFSGLFRRDMKLAAVSMLIIFLYGGMIWGILPLKERVSWESHLMGLLSGLLISYFYRKDGPQRKKYEWELEEEDDEEDTGHHNQEDDREIQIKYIYKNGNIRD